MPGGVETTRPWPRIVMFTAPVGPASTVTVRFAVTLYLALTVTVGGGVRARLRSGVRKRTIEPSVGVTASVTHVFSSAGSLSRNCALQVGGQLMPGGVETTGSAVEPVRVTLNVTGTGARTTRTMSSETFVLTTVS